MDRERPCYRKNKVDTGVYKRGMRGNTKKSERQWRIGYNKRSGYYKSTGRPDVSVKSVKNTVTRPVSSAFKQLKQGAEKYSGGADGDGGDGYDYSYRNPSVFRSPFLSRQRRNNELLEMIKALVRIIKAVIISVMTPVLIALAVVYLIVSTVVSILFGGSDSSAEDIVGPPIVIDDDSTPGDALCGELLWPCPSVPVGKITSSFGYREAPTDGASTYHRGIDIGASYGSDIVAAKSGVVSRTGYDSVRGNYAAIDHGNGMETWYLHMSRIAAHEGDIILRGEKVGEVGETGIATGPHLHFEVHVDGEQVDPMRYFE